MLLDVLLLHYGSTWDGIFYNNFLKIAKYYNYILKPLEQCSDKLEGIECLKNIKESLKDRDGVVMIINHDKNVVNVAPKKILSMVQTLDIFVTNINHQKDGVNIISTSSELIKKVEKSLETKIDHLKISDKDLDPDNSYFEEMLTVEFLVVDKVYKSFSALLEGTDRNKIPPVLLLNSNSVISTRIDDLLSQENKVKESEGYFDEIFVCINIPEQALFLEDFAEKLAEQDYDKGKMNVYLTFSNAKQKSKLEKFLKKEEFDTFKDYESDDVEGRIQCLKEFEKTSIPSIVFLSPVVILDEISTLSTMAAQKLNFVAPKLITNSGKRATLINDCNYGWNRSHEHTYYFPSDENIDRMVEENIQYMVF